MKLTTKVCSKCKEEKALADFGKCTSKRDGVTSHCKLCKRIASANYRKNNPDKAKQYYVNNREDMLERKKIFNKNNPEIRRYYRENNKEKIKSIGKEYRKNNLYKINERKKSYIANLADSYVLQRLQIRKDQATPELIELKRAQLQLTREIRNQTHGNN